MEKQQYHITLNTSPDKVWSLLWNDDTYRQWTAVFSEGSRAETDWKKGSKVLFLDNKNEGLVSSIAENIPNEFLSIKHLGIVKNGIEDTESEKVKAWSGAMENYTLKSVNGETELIVEMDSPDEMKDYFQNTWPKALQKLKELAENNN